MGLTFLMASEATAVSLVYRRLDNKVMLGGTKISASRKNYS